MTSEENLRILMQDYHRALNAQNYRDVIEFLDFPFELSVKGAKVQLNNAAEIVHAFKKAARVHKDRGVDHIFRRVDLAHIVDLREAIVGTIEEAFDAKGNSLVKWRSSYLLARRNGIWRITHANATGHDEAWEKVGSAPLCEVTDSSRC